MKKTEVFEIISNENIARDIFKMVLKADTSFIERPGQFVNITIPSLYLKRPISICDWNEDSFTLIFKVVGKGTKIMSGYKAGDTIEAIVGLGNGYDTSIFPDKVLVIGGGVGIPPLYALTKKLIKEGKDVTVILGYQDLESSFYVNEFTTTGAKVILSSNDGSIGMQGFVTDVMKIYHFDDIFYAACGPMPMLRAIEKLSKTNGVMSFEERMGCGFGACMGCTKMTTNGPKRVCTEGPVFYSEEIIWEN